MASWDGFSVTERTVLSFSIIKNKKMRILADMYLTKNNFNKKVGLVLEDDMDSYPIVQLISEQKNNWIQAVNRFSDFNMQKKYDVHSSELFYYIITLNEWENLFESECEKYGLQLIVLEEFICEDGITYRSGRYKTWATNCEKDIVNMKEWKKHIFRKKSDFNM